MVACVDACFLEISIEDVVSVTTAWNTIVDEQLHDYILSFIVTESEVFTSTA